MDAREANKLIKSLSSEQTEHLQHSIRLRKGACWLTDKPPARPILLRYIEDVLAGRKPQPLTHIKHWHRNGKVIMRKGSVTMDRFEKLERLVDVYRKQYGYSRENAIKAIRSDLLDMLKKEVS